jgi:hypothetical protein
MGHVVHSREKSTAPKVLIGKYEGKRTHGISRN